MRSHVRRFDETQQYEDYKESTKFTRPNVSYTLDNRQIRYMKADHTLTFVAKEAGSTIKIVKITDESYTGSDISAVSLEYSTNSGATWQTYTLDTTITLQDIDDSVKFRGINSTPFGNRVGDYAVYHNFVMTGRIIGKGDITSLINNVGGNVPIPAQYMFYKLFQNCTSLVESPKLPSTTLTAHCYRHMFLGAGLIECPILPAPTLVTYCYQAMFENCHSLVKGPELPALTLTSNCYAYMFYGCTSLVTAPALPATALADSCYAYMFQGCTSLINPPQLNATIPSTAARCYYYMFYGCTALVTPPALPSTSLASYCYAFMFYGCNNMTSAPELPATALQTNCYNQMFRACTKITTSPILRATTLVYRCYYYMFYGCSKLQTVTALFTTTPGTDLTNYWLYNTKSTGIFYKNPSATWDDGITRSTSNVPANWTIETYSGS